MIDSMMIVLCGVHFGIEVEFSLAVVSGLFLRLDCNGFAILWNDSF